MPIAATIEIPVLTKDPQEAVRQCLDIIRSRALETESLEVGLHLTCMANAGVLLRLAERLPSSAIGFQYLESDQRKLTTAEFNASPKTGMIAFGGKPTDYLLPADCLKLIEELLKSPPQAIRSTAFTINFNYFKWADAPGDSSGSLNLFDLKAFQRTKRFSLSACLHLNTEELKSAQTRELVKQISNATGIKFTAAKLQRTASPESLTPEFGDAILVGQICFDEAIGDAAGRFTKRFVSEFAPNAIPPDKAFNFRMAQRGTGEKVNLAGILKRIVKEIMPELKSAASRGDEIIFKKPLKSGAEILIHFDKSMPRVGKAFTIFLGVADTGQKTRYTSNIFRLERTTEQKTWVFASDIDADLVVREAVGLIQQVLPQFELSLKAYFQPWPVELPPAIRQYGKLTARQAFEVALPFARDQYSDAELARLGEHLRSLRARDIAGPETLFDGRNTKNSGWWFHFYSPSKDVSFEVSVPAIGRVRILDHGSQYRSVNARHWLQPVGETWMDSDRAFAIAEERGGRESRKGSKTFGTSVKLGLSPKGQASWGIMYMQSDDRGRNDFIIHIDAVTGETLADIRGF